MGISGFPLSLLNISLYHYCIIGARLGILNLKGLVIKDICTPVHKATCIHFSRNSKTVISSMILSVQQALEVPPHPVPV